MKPRRPKCNCGTPHTNARSALRSNAVLRLDPTRTTVLREKFARDMARRYELIRSKIRDAIVTQDVFGFTDPKNVFETNAPSGLAPGAFAFDTAPKKAAGFMNWLSGEVDKDILSIEPGTARTVTGNPAWTDTYIQSGYKKGITRGAAEMNKAGMDVEKRAVDAAFNTPIHADRVGLLYTRTFEELKGAAGRLEQKMSRVLSEELALGMAEGRGPIDISRALEKVVGLEKTYAKTLARTEIIRAHHVANINMYREAGFENVLIQAEWSTAGFNVCPDCADLEGRVFRLDEIEGLIPLHPNCRCIALPYQWKTGDAVKGEDTSIIGDQYRLKDGSFKKRGLFKKKVQGRFRKPGRPTEVKAPTKVGPAKVAKTKPLKGKSVSTNPPLSPLKGTFTEDGASVLADFQMDSTVFAEGYRTGKFLGRAVSGEPALRAAGEFDAMFGRMSRTVVGKPATFYRGVRKVPSGKQFVDKAFVSTTTDKKVAQGFAGKNGKVLKIEVPPGTRVLRVADGIEDLQDEFILDRGLSFQKVSDGLLKVVKESTGFDVKATATVSPKVTKTVVKKAIKKAPASPLPKIRSAYKKAVEKQAVAPEVFDERVSALLQHPKFEGAQELLKSMQAVATKGTVEYTDMYASWVKRVPDRLVKKYKGDAKQMTKMIKANKAAVKATHGEGPVTLYRGTTPGQGLSKGMSFWTSDQEFASAFAGTKGKVHKIEATVDQIMYSSRSNPTAAKFYLGAVEDGRGFPAGADEYLVYFQKTPKTEVIGKGIPKPSWMTPETVAANAATASIDDADVIEGLILRFQNPINKLVEEIA